MRIIIILFSNSLEKRRFYDFEYVSKSLKAQEIICQEFKKSKKNEGGKVKKLNSSYPITIACDRPP